MQSLKYYYSVINNTMAELNKSLGFALPYKKRMAMYRMLEKMTGEPASLQINDAVIELRGLEDDKGSRSPLWYIYDDVIEDMRSSDAGFAGAMAKFVPQQDTMIIHASEQDDITLGFRTVIENNKKTHAMKQEFMKALLYPSFLIVAVLGLFYYFSLYVIPVMAENIPKGSNISASSAFLIAMANSFYWWFSILMVTLVVMVISINWALPNLATKHRKYFEDIPPFNMYRLMIGCGFMFALNSLSRAGYIQIDALEQMLGLSKPYLRHRVEVLMDLMSDGKDLGEALIHSGLDFPDKQMVRELAIQVKYSEEDALEILSNTLAEDGLETIRAQAKVINIAITLFVFSCIGFLYLSIFGLGMELGNVQTAVSH